VIKTFVPAAGKPLANVAQRDMLVTMMLAQRSSMGLAFHHLIILRDRGATGLAARRDLDLRVRSRVPTIEPDQNEETVP
jgi:hypothetical protein